MSADLNGRPQRPEDDLGAKALIGLTLRHAGLAIGVAVLATAAAWIYVRNVVPIFEAHATVHVEPRTSAVPELEVVDRVLASGDVDTEMALLRARTNLESVVDTLALQVTTETPDGWPRSRTLSEVSASRTTVFEDYTVTRNGSAFDIVDSRGLSIGRVAPGEPIVFNGMRLVIRPGLLDSRPARAAGSDEERVPDQFLIHARPFYQVVDDVGRRISVGRPIREASLISVSFQDPDPELVYQVPNMLAETFIERRKASKRIEATSAVDFLTEQIDAYQVQLAAAEDALLLFRQGEQVVNLEAESGEQVRRLVDEQTRADELRSELESLDSLLAEIQAAQASPDPSATAGPFRRLAAFPTFLRNQAVTELMSELNRLESERLQMATRRTESHPDMVGIQSSVDQLEDQLHQLAINYRNSVRSQLQAASSRLSQLGGVLERIPEKALEEARLERQKQLLEELFTLLQTRLKEAEIAKAIDPGDVTIIDAAIAPLKPIRPRVMRTLILAAFFGLLLGVGMGIARENLDDSVKGRSDVLRITSLPLIAGIPRIKTAKLARSGAGDRPLVTRDDSSHPASEAFRSFRTNITFLDLDHPPKILALASPGPSEGKTTSAANLAVALAQQGTKTLLVDCDLRRGVVHRIFGVPQEPGLTNVLLGQIPLEKAIVPVELGPGQTLHVLCTGVLPPNPSELLGSDKMRKTLDELREAFGIVIIDTPPLTRVTDAAVLGKQSDGVVLVVRTGATRKMELRIAQEQLTAVGAHVLGIALNDLDTSRLGGYYGGGYGYGGYYSERYTAKK